MKKIYSIVLLISFFGFFLSGCDNSTEPQSLNHDVFTLNKGIQGKSGESNVYHYDLNNHNRVGYENAEGKITFQILDDGYVSCELNAKNLEPGVTYYLFCRVLVSSGVANKGGNLHLAGKFEPLTSSPGPFYYGFNLRDGFDNQDPANVVINTGGNLEVSYP